MRKINTHLRSKQVLELQKKFAQRIVGQHDAIDAVTNSLEKWLGGLSDPNRPIASLLFLGPTGTGKTAVVEAMADGLFKNPHAMLKIDCVEFQHSHEIAKLIGSPPGYLGHRETPARFTDAAIKMHQTAEVPFTIVLFDEIEKASDELWHLLLTILDKGEITLGDNTKTDFKKTVIIMTSNVGASNMSAVSDPGLGFQPETSTAIPFAEMKEVALSAARKKFTPEFLNRLDEIVMFNTLTPEQIDQVLDKEIEKAAVQVLVAHQTMMFVSPAAKKELSRIGYDKRYNARNIRRALEKEIITPIARAISSGEILTNMKVVVDFSKTFDFWSVNLGEKHDAFAAIA